MAVTVEEIEIIVRAKVEEALKELRKVQPELQKIGAASLSNISSQAKTIAPSVSKAAEAVKKSNKEIQAAAKAAADQYGDLNKIIQETEKRAKNAATHTTIQQRSADLGKEGKVLTPTAPLNAYMQDKMSYENLMASIQGNWLGSNVASQTQEATKQAQAQIEYISRMKQETNRVIAALRKLGPVGRAAAQAVAAATGQATNETKKYEKQVQKTAGSAKSAFGSLGHYIKRALSMVVVWGGMRAVTSTIKEGIQSAIAAPETENLFRVALGKMSDDAEQFSLKLRDNLGLDEYITKDMLGIFQQIGTAVGVGQNTAFGMSKSMTMLANDMASLYNVDPQQAYENLQSALTGQGRAVRKYGFVITEQTIKEAAWRNGLVKNGQELNEQQKYVARGIALMEQSKNAQGDMGRTIGNVQNQLRVLQQRLAAAKRSIGQAFIPVIQAALPWLNAFAILLQRVGTALAKWTYNKMGMDYDAEIAKQKQVIDGYNGIAAAEDEIGDSAENAGKKAQKSLLPIDQINRLQSPAESKSSSSSSSGAGYDPGWGHEPDTGALENFEALADKLKEKLEKILPVVTTIGTAFAMWKIGKPIFHGLESILGVKGLKGVLEKLGLSGGAVAGVAAAVLICVARFTELYTKSEKFRLGLKTIWDGFLNGAKTALNWIKEKFTGLYNYIFPEEVRNEISSALDALDIDFGDLGITIAGIAAMCIPGGQVVGAILLGFEAITLAIRGVGYAAEDYIQPVDLFQDSISNVTKTKVEPFVQQLRTLDDEIKSINWGGEIITDENVKSISEKAKAIRETIVKELDEGKKEATDSLKSMREAMKDDDYDGVEMSNAEYQNILSATDRYYEKQKQKTKAAEAEITAIYKKAKDKNRTLNEKEAARVAELQEQMQTTGITALSETEAEAQAIMLRMKENSTRVSLEQASEVIKNAQKTRDQTIDAARVQMLKIKDEAKRLREAGEISEEEYNKMVKSADDSFKFQENEAKKTYEGILDSVQTNLGETSKYIDTETGEIKSNWQVFKEEISKKASETWKNIKTSAATTWEEIKSWWNTNVAKYFTKEFWIKIWDSIVLGAKEKLGEVKDKVYSWWEEVKGWYNDNIAPKFTKKYWKDKFNSILDSAKEVLSDLKKRFENWKAEIKTPHMYWDNKDGFNTSGLIKKALEALNLPTVIPKLKVQWLATGGILNRAQFIGAGEAGAEAIVPLERNLGWLKRLAEQIVREMESYAAIPTVTVDQFKLPQNRVNYSGAEVRTNTAGSSDVTRANSALIRQLLSEVRALRNDVKRIDPCVQIGDDKIYNSAVRGGKREALATGRPAFGI